MIVRDPSRVVMAVPPVLGANGEGVQISKMVESEGGVAGINAGLPFTMNTGPNEQPSRMFFSIACCADIHPTISLSSLSNPITRFGIRSQKAAHGICGTSRKNSGGRRGAVSYTAEHFADTPAKASKKEKSQKPKKKGHIYSIVLLGPPIVSKSTLPSAV